MVLEHFTTMWRPGDDHTKSCTIGNLVPSKNLTKLGINVANLKSQKSLLNKKL